MKRRRLEVDDISRLQVGSFPLLTLVFPLGVVSNPFILEPSGGESSEKIGLMENRLFLQSW